MYVRIDFPDILFHSFQLIVRVLRSFCCFQVEVDQLARQLSETFTPDDGLLFGPNSVLDWFHNRAVAHTDESLSLDEAINQYLFIFALIDHITI